MLALRYVYVLALVVWLGGMVVLGAVVAPTTFQVLQASEPVAGRALAGELFGVTLARFHYVAYAAGAVLLLSLAAMAVLGPRPAHFLVADDHRDGHARCVALYSGFVVLGGIDADPAGGRDAAVAAARRPTAGASSSTRCTSSPPG